MSTILTTRSQPGESLSLDEMRRRFPTIFADRPHDSRSSRYVYVSTESVMSGLMTAGFLPVAAQVQRSRDPLRQEYAKHTVRFRMPDAPGRERRIGDTTVEVMLRNSHDGSSVYELFASLFRLACLNGMVVGAGTIESVKVRHTGNVDRQVGEVVRGAERVMHDAPKVIEHVARWRDINLTPAEQTGFADEARTIRFGDADGKVDSPVEPRHLLEVRRYADQGDDLWSVFNRVQENCTKGGVAVMYRDPDTRRRRILNTREVRSIDGDLKINRALWQVAERTAALKAAA